MRKPFLVGRMSPDHGRTIVMADGGWSPTPRLRGAVPPGPWVLVAVIRPPDHTASRRGTLGAPVPRSLEGSGETIH